MKRPSALTFVLPLLATLWCKSALAAGKEVRRFALVIGNNAPAVPTAERLRYADDDAASTHRMLRDAGVESFLLVTLDADSRPLFEGLEVYGSARGSMLERAYAELLGRMQAVEAAGFESELFLFYSGHGDVEHGEGFLALEDEKLTRSKLFALLQRSTAARNHVFIDACKSYFLAFDRGPSGKRTPYAGAMVKALPAELTNTGFVLSTSSDRESHEWERYQGGILSHELRSALRGAADTNLDAHISYAELGAFLTTANQGIKNPRFRPDFTVRPPEKDFKRDVLAWQGERAPLSLAKKTWGHFYVEAQNGERLLDAHPAEGQALSLWMPRERPLFVRSHDGQAEYVLATSEPTLVAELGPATREIQSRGAVSLAFEQLFAVPFGESDVANFRMAPPNDHRWEVPDTEGGQRLPRTLAGLSLGSLAGGLTLTVVGLTMYVTSEDDAQVDIDRANEIMPRMHYASIGLYALAAGAGAWWLALRARSSVSVSPRGQGMLLRAQHTF